MTAGNGRCEMKSIDVANAFIIRHGHDISLTNLTLNKLVYFAQVESLRRDGSAPLFDDAIEAWDYGPVEPCVYHAFKHYGRNPIHQPSHAATIDDNAIGIVDDVASRYGRLTAFDLVELSHRDGGAWKAKYVRGANAPITIEDMLASDDVITGLDTSNTLESHVRLVEQRWPNALRMLEDS